MLTWNIEVQYLILLISIENHNFTDFTCTLKILVRRKIEREKNIMSLLDVLMKPFCLRGKCKATKWFFPSKKRDFIRNSMPNWTLNIYSCNTHILYSYNYLLHNGQINWQTLWYWSIPPSQCQTIFFLFASFFYLMIKCFLCFKQIREWFMVSLK